LKLICFDCDTTLSSIEGIDELARLRGPEAFARVEALTSEAMNGSVRMEDVFGRRMEIVRPGSREVEAVGRRYVETVEPTAKATIAELARRGWTPVIISGGFRQTIRPLADYLGVSGSRRSTSISRATGPTGATRPTFRRPARAGRRRS